jgi:hypothetical protein
VLYGFMELDAAVALHCSSHRGQGYLNMHHGLTTATDEAATNPVFKGF